MRIFQACGVAHEVAPFTAPHPGTHYLGVDREIIRIYDPQPPPHPLGFVPSATFAQPAVEAVLRAGVARSGGADVFLATQAVALATHDDCVDVTVRAVDGSSKRVLLGATSSAATAPTASCAACARHRSTSRTCVRRMRMVVDARLTRPVLPEKCIQYCWPERPATFIRGRATPAALEIEFAGRVRGFRHAG